MFSLHFPFYLCLFFFKIITIAQINSIFLNTDIIYILILYFILNCHAMLQCYYFRLFMPYFEQIMPFTFLMHYKKADEIFFATIIFYSISLTIFLTGRTKVGDTDSSSSPISTNLSVSVLSAPSSPQIPAQIPSLCALSTTIWIIRRTAS